MELIEMRMNPIGFRIIYLYNGNKYIAEVRHDNIGRLIVTQCDTPDEITARILNSRTPEQWAAKETKQKKIAERQNAKEMKALPPLPEDLPF
jgi:hypothetical protein